MGLDMYLAATLYLSNWDHNSPDLRFAEVVKAIGLTPTEASPSINLEITIGYWRKANAIHNWFVTHVAGGEDNCEPIDVSRKQLQTLRDLCQQVLDTAETKEGQIHAGTSWDASGQKEHYTPGIVITNPKEVAELLPTTSGFFFGSTDYDEGYLEDLRHTIEIIDHALSLDKEYDFQYRASW
jgi:hypothetical protein